MSYFYSSDSLDIKNPFKFEGKVNIFTGVIILLIGIIDLFMLRGNISQGNISTGWFKFLVCISLIGLGIRFVFIGITKVVRFYVGSGIPSSLTRNISRSESHVKETEIFYTTDHLEQMLLGRKNPTFLEPTSFVDQLVYSIFPKFLFLPLPMRNHLSILCSKAAYSFALLTIYILTLMSDFMGLFKSNCTQWCCLLFSLVLLVIWSRHKIRRQINIKVVENLNKSSFAILIVAAVLLPALMEFVGGKLIPPAPINALPFVFIDFLLITTSVVISLYLAKERSDMINPLTEVSEYKDHWQENIHPKNFYQGFEMEMANYRFKELPNRVYRNYNPSITTMTKDEKGTFKGDCIYETQPVSEEINYSQIFKVIRSVVTSLGSLLTLIGCIMLFIQCLNIGQKLTVQLIFSNIYLPIMLISFGTIISNIAHYYWAEINFKSYLVQFFGEGTYTESKISVGMSIYDSARSENEVIRSNFNPWILVSELRSTTISSSGSKNLEGFRYVFDIRSNDELLNSIVTGLKNYLGSRQTIASSFSDKDLDSINAFSSVNSLIEGKKDKTELLPEDRRQ